MKLFQLCALLVFFLTTNAQQTKITWDETDQRKLSLTKLLLGNGNDILNLSYDFTNKTDLLLRYNNKLVEKSYNDKIHYDFNDKKNYLDNIFNIKGKIFAFYRHEDNDKQTSFSYRIINGDNLLPNGSLNNLDVFKFDDKKVLYTKMSYFFSEDSSKILFVCSAEYIKRRDEKNIYYLRLFDRNMNKIWSKQYECPNDVAVTSCFVTNDGNVGLILKHHVKEISEISNLAYTDNNEENPSYKTKLLLFEKGTDNPYEFDIDPANSFVHSIQLANDSTNSNSINFIGMYKTIYNGNINGLFISSFSLSTHKFEINKTIPFPAELLNSIKNDAQGYNNGKKVGISNYFKFTQKIDREDGSRDYLLEYNDYNTTFFSNSTLNYLYYGDIIDISLKSNGNCIMSRIPKAQMTLPTLKDYCSFTALTVKDKLILYYNDVIENMKRNILLSPAPQRGMWLETKNAALIMVTVDGNGNVNREIATNYSQEGHTPILIQGSLIFDKNHIVTVSPTKYSSSFRLEKGTMALLELK